MKGLVRLVGVAIVCLVVACQGTPDGAAAGPVPGLLVANGVRYADGGRPLDAHSGTILRGRDGYFYLYGETYACGFRWTDRTTPYCGVQVYRSADMSRWQGPWAAFDASTPFWQDLCMHQAAAPGGGCFRPKVVFNRRTQLYVLWLNTPGLAGDGYRVLASRSPTGPFALVAEPDLDDAGIPDWKGRPNALNGDEGLFVDPSGAGWLVWNRGGRLLQERLNPAFTSGAGGPLTIMNYPEVTPWAGVEAPSEFEHAGTYYLAMSLPRCPYCTGTGTAIEMATAPGGPWTYQGVVSVRSCDGQPNEVDELAPGMLLWSSDQWVRGGAAGVWPRLNETMARQAWEPIAFDGSRVAPIACASSFWMPLA